MKEKIILTVAAFSLVTGCAHVREIGVVGNTRFLTVASPGVIKPSVNIIVSQDVVNTNDVKVVTAANGPGIGSAVAGAGGNVAGAFLLREAFHNNGVSVVAEGGDASATAAASGYKGKPAKVHK